MDNNALLPRLAVSAAVIAVGLAVAGCDPRPRDPKPPADPARNVPKPITGAALPAFSVVPAAAAAR